VFELAWGEGFVEVQHFTTRLGRVCFVKEAEEGHFWFERECEYFVNYKEGDDVISDSDLPDWLCG
jgi:hypothetical protein